MNPSASNFKSSAPRPLILTEVFRYILIPARTIFSSSNFTLSYDCIWFDSHSKPRH